MRSAVAPLLLLLTGCSAVAETAPKMQGDRVVSLDYCADQMVLGLLPHDRIAAVSFEADSDASYSAPRARGIARIRPSLEEILRLRPSHVVRLYGGAPGIDRQLAALGIRVVQLNFSSKLSDIPAEVSRVGALLDATPMAKQRNMLFAERLTAAQNAGRKSGTPTLLYMTPGDVTTGPDSLVGEIIHTAGFRSIRSQPGWASLPIEAMVRQPPAAVFRAFFDSPRYRQNQWSAALHPRLQAIVAAVPTVTVPGSAVACGNWLAGDAVSALSALRAKVGQGS